MSTRTPTPQAASGSPPRPRRRLAPSAALEVAAALVVAVVVSLGIQATINRLTIPYGTYVALSLTAGAATITAGALALAAFSTRGLAAPLTWAGLSALATAPIALLLAGTRHFLFGVSGDQEFRVQYLTRFADSARLSDVAYADLPPFYPAGWFWVGGRLARLVGIEPWAFYKPFAITTLAVAAVVAFLFWSRVTTRTRALGLAVATVLAGLVSSAAYSPYSWLTAALVAPAAVLGVQLTDAACQGERPRVGPAVAVGAVLGVAAVTHTQVAVFAVLVLAVAAGVGLVRSRTRGAVALLRPAGVIALTALPLVAVFWTPYLLARLAGGAGSDAAQRFLPVLGARFPFPMLEASGVGVLALTGIVWIVLRATADPLARGLAVTTACGYAWYLLSALALGADTTLLSFRIEPVLTAALACGAVGAAADSVRFVRDRWPDLSRRLPALVAVLAVVVVVAQVQNTPVTYAWTGGKEYTDYYPDGTRPGGAPAATDPGAYNGALATTLRELTARPPDDMVLLSTEHALATFVPYRTWLTSQEQYSNPLADYRQRQEQVIAWSASRSPADLLAALDASPRRTPSVFVFARGTDGTLHVRMTYSRFPAETPGSVTAQFDPRLFADRAFVRRDVGPYTVVVRVGV